MGRRIFMAAVLALYGGGAFAQAPQGSADHQDMLLRIYYDGDPRPAVEAPLGDFGEIAQLLEGHGAARLTL